MFPIAESFHSPQGEGVWTGTPMHFVRLAGCNVGKYGHEAVGLAHEPDLKIVEKAPSKHSVCTTFDGQRFLCDTDYHKSFEWGVIHILEETWEGHICLTGGEPFLHDLSPLVKMSEENNLMLHIETSGTLPIPPGVSHSDAVWITCSPKWVENSALKSNLPSVNEVKFVVGEAFNEDAAEGLLAFTRCGTPVYIQPVNPVNSIDQEGVERCLKMQRRHPEWRLSIQMHKAIGKR